MTSSTDSDDIATLPALVIGAGPAGLMAAEAISARGIPVLVAEAKPSPARKFLMAGRSGLNLTKAEAMDRFRAAYGEADWLTPALDAFGPEQARGWAEGLGQACFTGSSRRVFPQAMKASPLLRAWLARLEAQGARLARSWRWTGWQGTPGDGIWRFETPQGPRRLRPGAVVLAMGGASWARLGADGDWAARLGAAGLPVSPFRPANMGFSVDWSPEMTRHFGTPVKSVALSAGGRRVRAEFVISERGIEGGGVYALYRELREGATLVLDLAPDLERAEVARRLARARPGDSLSSALRKALKLDPARRALLMEWGGPLPSDAEGRAARIKALPARLAGPRPLDEAISVAGGLRAEALDADLMLRALPGVYAAGEMLDWEAPTGGYLITACLATGRWAGEAAARRLLDAGRGAAQG